MGLGHSSSEEGVTDGDIHRDRDTEREARERSGDDVRVGRARRERVFSAHYY